MPKKRPIPEVDTKSTATEGAIVIKQARDGRFVCFEVHHCTMFLQEEESMSVLLSLLHTSMKIWGQNFIRRFLTYVEQL